jgi:magnesium transporter
MSEPTSSHPAADATEQLPPDLIAEAVARLSPDEAADVVGRLAPEAAGRVLADMHPEAAASILERLRPAAASAALAAVAPDDRVDVLEQVPPEFRRQLVGALPPAGADEVRRLEQYAPDTAGGIMTTDVAALPEGLSVDQAVAELRGRRGQHEPLYYVYAVDADRRLVGVLSLRDLILSEPATRLGEIARRDVVAVEADTDQERVAALLRRHSYLALPVVDAGRRVLGLVTADDVADVIREEATEDIQKLGGTEAFDTPYLRVGLPEMVRRRGVWLSVLFLGEMLTATAMAHFEGEIARAVVLALFVPLIISSGGNSGSQAATIVVRSLALSELRPRDWWRVLGRELRTGLTLGLWLGLVGFVRVVLWQRLHWVDYGPHYLLLGATVWVSLAGVVSFGGVAGGTLPFLLRALGFDPATSSAPFVATLVDVTGLVIYFGTAMVILKGTIL